MAVNFALTPTLATEGDLLDYTSTEGQAIFNTNTKSFHPEKKKKYNLNKGDLRDVIKAIVGRVVFSGMLAVFTAPLYLDLEEGDEGYEEVNILEHPHELDVEHLREYSAPIVTGSTREAQDNAMVYLALVASFSAVALNKLDKHKDKYLVLSDDETIERPSAMVFFKLIVMESKLDTNKTAAMARHAIYVLPKEIKKVDYDIDAFHDKVTDELAVISSHKQTMDDNDLILFLFASYNKVPDEKFSSWVDRAEENYNNGGALDSTTLMNAAKLKYDTLIADDDAEWCGKEAKQQEQEDLVVALQSQLVALESKLELVSKQKKAGGNSNNNGSTPARRGKRTRAFEPWELKRTTPTIKRKNKAGKMVTYNWCEKHNRYVRHLPEKCELQEVEHPAAIVNEALARAQADALDVDCDSDSDSDSDSE